MNTILTILSQAMGIAIVGIVLAGVLILAFEQAIRYPIFTLITLAFVGVVSLKRKKAVQPVEVKQETLQSLFGKKERAMPTMLTSSNPENSPINPDELEDIQAHDDWFGIDCPVIHFTCIGGSVLWAFETAEERDADLESVSFQLQEFNDFKIRSF